MWLLGIEFERQSDWGQVRNQYHLAQRGRRTKGIMWPEKFEDCFFEWETKEEEELYKLTHLQSICVHYKKYIVEKWKIILQKLNCEIVVARVLYDGHKDAKKIDLAQPSKEAKPAYISTDLTTKEEEQLIVLLK